MVAGYASAGGPLVLGILRSDGLVQELVQCPLYEPQIHQAWSAIYAWLAQLQIAPYLINTRRGELKYVVLFAADGQLMLRLVLRSKAELDRIRKHAPALYALLPALRVLGPPSVGSRGDAIGAMFIAAQIHRLLDGALATLARSGATGGQ